MSSEPGDIRNMVESMKRANERVETRLLSMVGPMGELGGKNMSKGQISAPEDRNNEQISSVPSRIPIPAGSELGALKLEEPPQGHV